MQRAKGKRQNGGRSILPFAFCIVPFALLGGCQPQKADRTQPPVTMPEYYALAERYNANLAGLDRMRARASVRLFFRDSRGKWKTETGEESLVMFERPHGVALSLGKLGKTAVWAGCNKDQYWLFDVMESRTVWYGRTANIARAREFPLPVHPQRLISLLGATPINPDVATDHNQVRWESGAFVIDVPEENLRLWLDPRTAMPRQIVMLDEGGEAVVWSKLTGEMRVEKADLPREQWPRIADRAEMTIKGQEGTLTMWLKDATDGRGNERYDRALRQAFDFNVLLGALRPQDAVDLDN